MINLGIVRSNKRYDFQKEAPLAKHRRIEIDAHLEDLCGAELAKIIIDPLL